MDTNTIKEQYETGILILTELFKLPFTELREKIKEICGEDFENKHEHLFKEGTVTKTFTNDIPKNIEIWFYDHLTIHPFGITYNPEHGEGRQIVLFNKHFKL